MNDHSLTERGLEEFRGTNPSVWYADRVGIADSLTIHDGKLAISFKWLIVDHRLMNSDYEEFENPKIISTGDALVVQSGDKVITITNLVDYKFSALKEQSQLEKKSHH